MNIQFHALTKAAAGALLLCGLATQASAQAVVLDTFGPDTSYLTGWPNPLRVGEDIAIPFEIASATSIQSILTSLVRVDGSGGVTLGVLTRQGALPGSLTFLHSTHVDPTSVDAFVHNTLVSPAGWALNAGSYWLVAVADAGFEGQWQSGTDAGPAPYAVSTSSGVWTAVNSSFTGMPGVRITVTSAVPEPATYGLMFAGGLLVAMAARRKSTTRQQG
jgi:hypothetical protein